MRPPSNSTTHRWPAGLDVLDSAEALQSTTNVQLALLISGVAAARALTDDRGLVPAFVAGHSVGGFAAAVTAGVLTFAEAVAAVRLRGDLMQQKCSSGQWGMAAVLGLRLTAVSALADRVTTPDEPVGSPTSMPPTRSSCPVASQRSSDPRPHRVRRAPVDGRPSR